MDRRAAVEEAQPLSYEPQPVPLQTWSNRSLLRELTLLAIPILAENLLHIAVGVTDVYLAGNLKTDAVEATAAIGTIAYILWLIALIGGAIGTGSTAIVARAIGGRHRSLANAVTGQSIGAAFAVGVVAAVACAAFAVPIAHLTRLTGDAEFFALYYLRVLAIAIPFTLVTTAAGACLRGAGDSLSPAIAMIVVDIVNVICSFALTRGWWGLPEMGFRGIAVGTVIAYVTGGVLLVAVLLRGGKIRLYLHRLRPHWHTLKRILKIGLPTVLEVFTWLAQFAILAIINQIDKTNVSGAAHMVTIRVESFSFMGGLAVATATATLVGQSLGRKDPLRAARSAYLAYAIAASYQVFWSLLFITKGRSLAGIMTNNPDAATLAGQCLFVTAFAQPAFAAALVFGGSLRGAGDTVAPMIINVASTLGVRLTGVIFATLVLGHGLTAVWVVLGGELTLRGGLFFLRFLQGRWRTLQV